ncbi:hypothetical protein FNF27_05619 [Cafeteria roenbergensis]|uniref:EamA domain-containing protein n=2 Tax=Cafeteria roenbergensis TaxID=33653 RepID=A0A5A8DJQ5_CAFRO|nr:hypothetical protein FNF29_04837 [Cafeteria roenbergensis]KAA0164894.1 hypothetical protein FNF31_02217 [Cafeteria roenbergensis]KAA0172865.1 hypothetical protein FNF27_05619 [Cafeteria roenbergensis]|eukprot:KAA0151145.1 hypothetical protein FNF29_04837 [Cafeteria roenbergensis]
MARSSGKQVGDASGEALLLGEELQAPEVDVEEEPSDKAGSDRALLIVFGIMVAVGLCNNILRVLQFGPMHNYALFTNLLTTFVYLPTSWGYVYFNWSKLTDDEKAIPWYKWAIMGGLDSMAGILQSIAVAFVSNGTLVTLLLQSAIPVSMIFTRLFTKKRYKWFNYVGAVAVLIGIAIVLAPKLAQPDSDSTSSGPGGLIVWALVLVASCVPMTLSSVYKELNLGDADCDAWHMNGQVALYQFIASFILLYPSGLIEGIPADDLWQNIWGGFRCLATLNTAANDDCSSAPYLVTAYCVANLGYNVLIIVILKMGGSNLLWLCLTTMVPMASFFFALPFVPIANRSTITPYTGIGLVVILGGLVIYRFYDTAAAFVRRITGSAPAPEEAPTKAIGDYVAMDISIDDGSVNGAGSAPSPVTSSTPVRGVGAMHVPRRKRK